jgi:hypothetical protein
MAISSLSETGGSEIKQSHPYELCAHNYDLTVVTLETAVVKRGDFMATNLLKDPFNAVPSSLGIELDWRVPSS